MMARFLNIYFSILFLFFVSYSIHAQPELKISSDEFKKSEEGYKEAWKALKTGDKHYLKGDFTNYLEAITNYNQAYQYNSENAELNFKIGFCIINTLNKGKAVKYFEKSFTNKPNILPNIHLYLAKAYHYNYQFEDAIKEYQIFQKEITSSNFELLLKEYPAYVKGLLPSDIELFKKIINRSIEECKNGIVIQKRNPERVFIDNITEINSIFPDYCPLITADESMMIFTSRREGGIGNKTYKGIPYEDIYISFKEGEKWSTPVNAGIPLNTKEHDATIGLSPDGQNLLTYRNGDIYISYLKGDKWTEPELLPGTINTDENENSACFSPDGNTIYFIRGRNSDDPSNSKGDIFVSKKVNGQWSEGKNLGPVVNTPFDEDGVYMHPDGKTLYFSSKGHNSVGGFDIFKTTLKNDGTWTKPNNLGFPINTPDDDVYFVMSANGRRAYYSTIREDGQGYTDIYVLTLLGPEKPILQNNEDNLIASITNPIKENPIEKEVEIKTIRLTIVKGTITDALTKIPVEATIEIVDNEKNQIISTLTSNAKTGKYLLTLPSGKNYGIAVKAENYLFHSENFDIPATTEYQEITKDIELVSIAQGSKVILKNIFFEYNKSTIRSESVPELERLVKLLKDFPKLNIEISGHTDNQGSFEFNKQLSESRAQAVVDWVIGKGITKSRLKARGASFSEPIAKNDSEEGRQLNRRVEFKVLSN